MKKSNNIDDFFKNNEVRIGKGKDFTTTPPLYYQSLDEAFFNYFKSLINYKDTFHLLRDFKSLGRKGISFNFSNTDSTVFTILGFHRFFELLLKDILKRINPFLSVKFLENEEQVITFLNDELEPDAIKSIEFGEALKRFIKAVNYFKQNSNKKDFEIAQKFEFLIKDDTLKRLAKWRNRIIHNGNTLPNIYLLDYLISQKVVPLVHKIFDVDKKVLKNYKPHYFETFTGIKIIEEILNIKFDYNDFTNDKKSKELALKILRIAHLKELGRATFNIEIHLQSNKLFNDPYYEDPIGRNKRFVESEKSHKSFYSYKKCPCCGCETLVIYRKEIYDIFHKRRDFISWFNCFTCSYSLKNNLFDPHYFGYSQEPLFAKE
jgi:hypothetical protein